MWLPLKLTDGLSDGYRELIQTLGTCEMGELVMIGYLGRRARVGTQLFNCFYVGRLASTPIVYNPSSSHRKVILTTGHVHLVRHRKSVEVCEVARGLWEKAYSSGGDQAFVLARERLTPSVPLQKGKTVVWLDFRSSFNTRSVGAGTGVLGWPHMYLKEPVGVALVQDEFAASGGFPGGGAKVSSLGISTFLLWDHK